MYAEVAVAVYVRQTFTYHLPDEMAPEARVGSRVTVPFGQKTLTGFIVELYDSLDEALGQSSSNATHSALEYVDEPATIKEVEELLDLEPVISPETMELTRWMADYYYAAWGECLRAALPSGATARSERRLEITSAGRLALLESSTAPLPAEKQGRTPAASGGTLPIWPRLTELQPAGPSPSGRVQILQLLAASPSLSSRFLEKSLPELNAAALIRQLERDGLVRVWQETTQTRLKPRLQNAVRLKQTDTPVSGDEVVPHARAGSHESSKTTSKEKLNEKQQRVIDKLWEAGDAIAFGDLLERANVSSSVVRTLEKRGLVEVFAREIRRDPLAHVEERTPGAITLTAEQQQALDQISERISERTYAAFLLHGVTGSGKTEVYIRAIRTALAKDLSALMMVPEISLTPVFSRRLRVEFGQTLAMLHSSMSEGERGDEWRRIRSGEARVVIGTRSSVFAPLLDLGLIIIDEEHDTSYKQDESPRYSGRDTAIMRALQAQAVVILGSATPSMESYTNAKSGKYTYLQLERRYGERPLARVEIVDMREVFKRHGKQQIFSDELKAAIEDTFNSGAQTMVLLNRRGFSSFVLCRSCGLAVGCPNCDVTLTYHRYDASLQCHYCGYIRTVPRTCDACEGQYINYIGIGTEQLEARLKEMFPRMNIARLDRDTTRRRGSFEQIIMEFSSGGIDLLVGTQMIAKGHDFPNVALVGVVSVDGGLNLPDFRAAERTFQLLTQVAGRAGRGDAAGRVITQTYHPEHYSIECAATQNYEQFYWREVQFRRAMSYPPFTVLINLLVRHKNIERANEIAVAVAQHLRASSTDQGLRVLGPAPAPLSRLKGEHRIQVLIKAHNRAGARESLDIAMDRLIQDGYSLRSITVEVDPINLM